jgi:homoserine dehydrogenase
MSNPLRVAVAGLGTVGSSVIQLLENDGSMMAARAGRPIEVVAISAMNKNKARSFDTSKYKWVDNPVDLASLDNVDVIIELMGGSDGVAYELVTKAISNGHAIITANKALLAKHGDELEALCEKHKTILLYEAAVGGGIPIIKGLREGLAANRFEAVYGILNGTCNFILSRMRDEKRSFDDVLKEAQDLGFAEADPSFDVDGIDTAHKLCVLSNLLFGESSSVSDMYIDGIRNVSLNDIEYAQELGYSIKLIAMARQNEDEKLLQSVEPCLVPLKSSMAQVDGADNAILTQGHYVGELFCRGAGAGAQPTASAVVGDIIDLMRGRTFLPVWGVRSHDRGSKISINPETIVSRFYLRLPVKDERGVLASLSTIIRDHDLSVETMLQRPNGVNGCVDIVILTHPTQRSFITQFMNVISAEDYVAGAGQSFKVEAF